MRSTFPAFLGLLALAFLVVGFRLPSVATQVTSAIAHGLTAPKVETQK